MPLTETAIPPSPWKYVVFEYFGGDGNDVYKEHRCNMRSPSHVIEAIHAGCIKKLIDLCSVPGRRIFNIHAEIILRLQVKR